MELFSQKKKTNHGVIMFFFLKNNLFSKIKLLGNPSFVFSLVNFCIVDVIITMFQPSYSTGFFRFVI